MINIRRLERIIPNGPLSFFGILHCDNGAGYHIQVCRGSLNGSGKDLSIPYENGGYCIRMM